MSRRDEMLVEMGLGPVWRLRSRMADPGSGAEPVSEAAAAVAAGQPAPASPRDTPSPAREAIARLAGTPARTAPAKVVVADVASTPESEERRQQIAALGWNELKEAVSGCTACGLCRSRTNTVFGVGDEKAEWMIVGEAPGQEEDQRGEPFVGQAGRLLDSMLAAIDLSRQKNVYIANVLKCRPPGNRNPEPLEVDRCSSFLERQIALVQPRLIVAMGRFAAQTLLKTDASIASLRGKRFSYQGVATVVTYHPAYLLRNLPDKSKSWEDLCFAMETLAAQQAAASPASDKA